VTRQDRAGLSLLLSITAVVLVTLFLKGTAGSQSSVLYLFRIVLAVFALPGLIPSFIGSMLLSPAGIHGDEHVLTLLPWFNGLFYWGVFYRLTERRINKGQVTSPKRK
jgi:hypothetical protein